MKVFCVNITDIPLHLLFKNFYKNITIKKIDKLIILKIL